ncbi:MAG: hypothetical protein U0168_17380 [Nannocystaceae bacterium]
MQSESSPRLRLIAGEPQPNAEPMPLHDEVRATRRSVARLLRALHASGHPFTRWPIELVSRLAHADAVTARYLAEPDRVDERAAHDGVAALRAVTRAMVAGLVGHERARLRAFELAIRIDDRELTAPLVQPDRAPEESTPRTDESLRSRSLRAGLEQAGDASLSAIARRLGLSRRMAATGMGVTTMRGAVELEVEQVLRDDHLLGILVATLSSDALVLLGALVRDRLDARGIEAVLQQDRLAIAVGDAAPGPTPCAELESCGLAFRGGPHGRALWVPVELCHRLDGVLRAMGS